MIYTGVDGSKRVSVEHSILKKDWKLTSKRGKPVYAVPSDLSFAKVETTQIRDLYDLKKALALEVEEKFGEVVWDLKLCGDRYFLALIRDFDVPEDAYSFEPEIFSLARVCKALSVEDCFVLDLGKRKTTLVEVKGGELSSFRVVLKGGDFITSFLSEKAGIPFEEAERLKISEGLENKHVKDAFENILSSLGQELSKESVLLSGGSSKLKGIEEYFGSVLRNNFVSPELNTAFGASMKFVLRDCAPDFREEEVPDRDLKRVAVLLGLAFAVFFSANFGIEYAKKEVIREVRRLEREAFKREFPNLPTVAVRDQIQAMVSSPRYEVLSKLSLLSQKLEEGIEIYRIEFKEGKLKVVGSAQSEEILTRLGAKSVKKTPEGQYLFEVELQ